MRCAVWGLALLSLCSNPLVSRRAPQFHCQSNESLGQMENAQPAHAVLTRSLDPRDLLQWKRRGREAVGKRERKELKETGERAGGQCDIQYNKVPRSLQRYIPLDLAGLGTANCTPVHARASRNREATRSPRIDRHPSAGRDGTLALVVHEKSCAGQFTATSAAAANSFASAGSIRSQIGVGISGHWAVKWRTAQALLARRSETVEEGQAQVQG
ncbi:hypothetical protein QBC34DRAFT_425288 [Podospora aff. communis PSN243]|uniref:Secreted protein n=1 Tax=Podospora aff. communis PSN243 TaxID=3040156 RepID=A0AAV9GPL8_9PEZI|nr:hypothetical protein QBC34DRAFT_425288 [Podospora aff. communis PSN243]